MRYLTTIKMVKIKKNYINIRDKRISIINLDNNDKIENDI